MILKLHAKHTNEVRYINMDKVIRVSPLTDGALLDFEDNELWQEVTEPADFVAQLWAYGSSNV
jgi:hypothetical protein